MLYRSIKNAVEDFWHSLKFFLSSKEHRAVVREAFYGYSWDYAYIYSLLKCKLKEMHNYFSVSTIAVRDYKDIVKWIDKAIKMIDIMDESDEEWLRVENGVPTYVNQRNAIRFAYVVDYENKKIHEKDRMRVFEKYPDELRKEKAKHLLMKILIEKGESWWD